MSEFNRESAAQWTFLAVVRLVPLSARVPTAETHTPHSCQLIFSRLQSAACIYACFVEIFY